MKRRLLPPTHPMLAKAYFYLTGIYVKQDQFDEANRIIEKYVEFVDKDPQAIREMAAGLNEEAWRWVARFHRDGDRQQAGQAVEMARHALKLLPENSTFENTLGVALYRSGDWQAAPGLHRAW